MQLFRPSQFETLEIMDILGIFLFLRTFTHTQIAFSLEEEKNPRFSIEVTNIKRNTAYTTTMAIF